MEKDTWTDNRNTHRKQRVSESARPVSVYCPSLGLWTVNVEAPSGGVTFQPISSRCTFSNAILVWTACVKPVLTEILPDVPGFVCDFLQTQHLWDLNRRHGLLQIHLVCKEQHWYFFAADVWMRRKTLRDIFFKWHLIGLALSLMMKGKS